MCDVVLVLWIQVLLSSEMIRESKNKKTRAECKMKHAENKWCFQIECRFLDVFSIETGSGDGAYRGYA